MTQMIGFLFPEMHVLVLMNLKLLTAQLKLPHFLLEIFYHEFIQKLSWDLIRRWTSSMVSTTSQETNANINWQNIGRIQRAWYFLNQRRNLRVRRVNVATVDAI